MPRQSPPAGAPRENSAVAYHCNDFSWGSLRDSVLHQWSQQPPPHPSPKETIFNAEDANHWEAFHKRHQSTAFFKPRRYITAAFPQLLIEQPAQHIIELGAGTGSSIIPVLTSNSTARATVCDVSSTALDLLLVAAGERANSLLERRGRVLDAEQQGIARSRIEARVLDATDPSAAPLCDACAHAALLVFTLSAVHPAHMATVLQAAYESLRPGGVLLFRDYAEFDLPMVRFEATGKQKLGDRLYQRQDGTLAYFFSVEDMRQRAEDAGFAIDELKYACVHNRAHSKTGLQLLKRAFVHGVFSRPSD